MSRLMVVAGLHLDRAWPDLPPLLGDRLRAWSGDMLTEVVASATRHRADAVVILGDLFARSTVRPDTIERAAEVLGGFSGKVLIAPGPGDPIGASSPYEHRRFAANTYVWTEGQFSENPWFEGIYGAACTEAGAPAAPEDEVCQRSVFLHAAMPGALRRHLSQTAIAVTSQKEQGAADSAFVVPPLVGPPSAQAPRALIIQSADQAGSSARADVVGMPRGPGRLHELNVNRVRSSEELHRLVAELAAQSEPQLVRLVGTLPTGILLPTSAERDHSGALALDLEGLEYADAEPVAGDHSMRAEFLRAMSASPDEPRVKHQMTAHGLRALDMEAGQ